MYCPYVFLLLSGIITQKKRRFFSANKLIKQATGFSAGLKRGEAVYYLKMTSHENHGIEKGGVLFVKFTRRTFLKCSTLSVLSLFSESPFPLNTACAASAPASGNYYLAHRKELLDDFVSTLQGANQILSPELGASKSQQITQKTLARFESLLPKLPDVGGDKNPDTEFIPIAAWYVALHEPMLAAGKTPEDIGKLIYDLNVYSLRSYPPAQARALQEKLFSPAGLAELRTWASWTQQRELNANWVAYLIENDGQDFDYGINYTECGLVKYFRSQGVPELAPYVCLNDFPKSRTLGTGLHRSTTIANGDGMCNFRYKKDRPVIQDWSTEIAGIRGRL